MRMRQREVKKRRAKSVNLEPNIGKVRGLKIAGAIEIKCNFQPTRIRSGKGYFISPLSSRYVINKYSHSNFIFALNT